MAAVVQVASCAGFVVDHVWFDLVVDFKELVGHNQNQYVFRTLNDA